MIMSYYKLFQYFNSEKPRPTAPPEQARANTVAITLAGITTDRVSSTRYP